MAHPEVTYESLISVENVIGFTTEEALLHIGRLTDLSLDVRKIEGLKRAIELSEELQKRQLTAGQSATLDYFLANAWANLRSLSRADSDQVWDWEQQEMEKEIFHLRSALNEEGFRQLPKERKCQVLTNLANLLDHIGRFVEAIEYWNKALDVVRSFGVARGNRGIGLANYARVLYDQGHAAVFFKHAHADLKTALLSDLHEDARKAFHEHRMRIESVLSQEHLDKEFDMHAFSLGTSEQEIRYRRWCLENRLFLNPLNDLGSYPISARDILTTPDIVVGIGEGPYYTGYFNQMKQEFVSARYIYYNGINAEQPHFSDRDVLLYNTLDYPSYSLAVEEVKAAFRMAYSLFDKIAYFLTHYLRLSLGEKEKVYFRTLWYVSSKRDRGLRPEFQQRQNWALRGLFWLSKDLFEDKPGFKKSIEPDAQELHDIRNHLEHKYLKLHEELWPGPPSDNDVASLALADTLAYSKYRRDFEGKTLRLIKMTRAALIYLSLAIYCEEQLRAKERHPDSIVPGIPLYVWKDVSPLRVTVLRNRWLGKDISTQLGSS